MARITQRVTECAGDHDGATAGGPGGFTGTSLSGRWVQVHLSSAIKQSIKSRANRLVWSCNGSTFYLQSYKLDKVLFWNL